MESRAIQAAVWVVTETDLSSSATHRLTEQYNTVSQCSGDVIQPSNADSLSAEAYYTNSPRLSSTQQTAADFAILNRISYAHVIYPQRIIIYLLY